MASQFIFPAMVFAIPITAILANVACKWMKLKEKQIDALSNDSAERAAQYAAKTERLEQRVAVLERILTDRSTTLADEIDRLRDAPLN
jgi:phage shock protein B